MPASTSTMTCGKRQSSVAVTSTAKKAKLTINTVHRNIGYRCCPHIIPEILRRLDNRQKGWISDMEFNPLNSMPDCRLHKGHTMWLIHQVDCKTKSLVINGIPYPIKDHLNDIFGFHNGNIPVPVPRKGIYKSKPFKGKKEFRTEEAGRGIKLADAIEALVAMQDEEEFCRQFMMVFLCVYFAPTSGHNLNRNYMGLFTKAEQIKQMDWPQFGLDYLIQGIEDYNNSAVSNFNIHGCVGILPAMYAKIARPASIHVPEDVPVISSLTTSLLQHLASQDLMPGSSARKPRYGRLMPQGNVQDDIGSDEGSPPTFSENPAHVPASNVGISHGASTSSGITSPSQDQKILLKKLEDLDNGYNIRRENIIKFYHNLLESKLAELDQKKKADMALILANHAASQTSSLPVQTQIQDIAHPSNSPTIPTPSLRCPTNDHPISPPNVPTINDTFASPDIVNENSQTCQQIATGRTNLPLRNPGQDDLAEPQSEEEHDSGLAPLPESEAAATLSSLSNCLSLNGRPSHHAKLANQSKASPFMQKVVDIGHQASAAALLVTANDGVQDEHPALRSAVSKKLFCTDPTSASSQDEHPTLNESLDSDKVQLNSSPTLDDSVEKNILEDPTQAGLKENNPACRPNDLTDSFNKVASVPSVPSMPMRPPDQSSIDQSIISSSADPIVNKPAIVETGNLSLLDIANASVNVFASPQVVSQSFDFPSMPVSSVITNKDCPPNSDHEYASTSDDLSEAQTTENSQSDSQLDSQNLNKPEQPSPTFSQQFGTLTPGPSLGEYVDITDTPATPLPEDVVHIAQLKDPILGGRSFTDPGSINTATKCCPQRYQKKDDNTEGIAELVKNKGKSIPDMSYTYQHHVKDSRYRSSRRKSAVAENDMGPTKVRICGASVTEKEFVHSLMPKGHVDLNFMWLCNVAIMQDWRSNTKLILNQPIIKEFMKPYHACDHSRMANRLKKYNLHLIEQLFLPVCDEAHWILLIVNFAQESAEIYDSLRNVKKGEDPHKDLWKRIGTNLQIAYNVARGTKIGIFDKFKQIYPKTHMQTNNDDCGFFIIRTLECHNGKDLVGNGKISMTTYRMVVRDTLVHHRLNDLNPYREELMSISPVF